VGVHSQSQFARQWASDSLEFEHCDQERCPFCRTRIAFALVLHWEKDSGTQSPPRHPPSSRRWVQRTTGWTRSRLLTIPQSSCQVA